MSRRPLRTIFFFFFLNDPAPPEIYPLSLHDALPIWSTPISLRRRSIATAITLARPTVGMSDATNRSSRKGLAMEASCALASRNASLPVVIVIGVLALMADVIALLIRWRSAWGVILTLITSGPAAPRYLMMSARLMMRSGGVLIRLITPATWNGWEPVVVR